MVLSKHELATLEMLQGCDGPMPANWIKPKYRSTLPRLRELGLLRKRDPAWAHLTKLGRAHVGPAGIAGEK